MAYNDESLGKFCAKEGERAWDRGGKNVESAEDGNTMSDDSSGPVHRVFLSHSGVQKDFVHQLFEDLERCERQPFFDQSWGSLPKGKCFPEHIFQAIDRCEVGVVVLSEDFMQSKWPMLELVAMTKNPNLKIIPVFLNISPKQIRDPKNRKRWLSIWRPWARADKGRINIEEWSGALGVLSKVNGLVNVGQGDVNFRKEIVAAVCELVRPQIKWNDSHVRGRSRLCEIICKRIDGAQVSQKYGFCILGLYGVGGIGKTTVCQALCNEYLVKMRGRVCHMELKSGSKEEWLALLQKALQALTNKRHDVLGGLNQSQCEELLRGEMQKQALFLAIDNVWDSMGSIDRVQTFLSRCVHGESVVIVTSRSSEVLKWSLLSIDEGNCVEMPELEEEEAKSLFLQHATLDDATRKEIDDDVVTLCVGRCYFRKGDGNGYHYHPLALKVLGGQLGMTRRYDKERWVAQLKNIDTFNQLREPKHLIFSILRRSFDNLMPMDKLLFMDVALFLPKRGLKRRWSAFEWLSRVHGISVCEVMQGLEGLKRKSLLEDLGDGCSKGIGMHDLWHEFSKLETKDGELDHRTWLYEEGEWSTLDDSTPVGGCWQKVRRMCFLEKGLMSLKRLNLDYFSNVTVIKVTCSKGKHPPLILDLRKLKHLKSLEVNFGGKVEVLGLIKVENLRFLSINTQAFANVEEIGHLTNLEVLCLQVSIGNSLLDIHRLISLQVVEFKGFKHVPSICGLSSRLTSLRYLDLSYCCEVGSVGLGFGDLVALEELYLRKCSELEEVPNLQKLIKLEKLEICNCPRIRALPSMGQLVALRDLCVGGCTELKVVPNLSKLMKLEELMIRGCPKIRALPGLSELFALQLLLVGQCYELEAVPNLQKLTKLEHLMIHGCLEIRALPSLHELVALEDLDVWDCPKLEAIPNLQKLTKLEILMISCCQRIRALLGLDELVALQHLEVWGCSELEVVPNLQKLAKLEKLQIRNCPRIRALPGLGELVALQHLSVRDCPELEKVPNLQKLTKLEKLKILGCPRIRAFPCLGELVALQHLSVRDCLELEKVPNLQKLTKLEKLKILGCPRIRAFPCLGELVALDYLDVCYCPKLEALQNLYKLTKLQKLEIYGCSRISALPSLDEVVALHLEVGACPELEVVLNLQKLTKLEKLQIKCCPRIRPLLGLGELVALQDLDIQGCHEVEAVPNLQKLTKLEKVQIPCCLRTSELPSLGEVVALQDLDIWNCPELQIIQSLQKLTKLEKLKISNCPRLSTLPSVDDLVALQDLCVEDCTELKVVPNLLKLTKLEKLVIWGCPRIRALPGLSELFALQFLLVWHCHELEAVPNLQKLTKLERLIIHGCLEIRALPSLHELVALEGLEVWDCPKLEAIPNLQKLTKLENLEISHCRRIRALPGLDELVALQHLEVWWCSKFEVVPNLQKLTKLEKLQIGNCPRIRALPGLGELVALQDLDI